MIDYPIPLQLPGEFILQGVGPPVGVALVADPALQVRVGTI
jgi:hypothetical protein